MPGFGGPLPQMHHHPGQQQPPWQQLLMPSHQQGHEDKEQNRQGQQEQETNATVGKAFVSPECEPLTSITAGRLQQKV